MQGTLAPTLDFNPRSPHGERHTARPKNGGLKDISTHAPRTGSDKQVWLANRMAFEFQPTLPARGATPSATRAFGTSRFQPTLPARGATAADDQRVAAVGISTHAPRTGSDLAQRLHGRVAGDISTHAPRTGSDADMPTKTIENSLISTHAPRTGSDAVFPDARTLGRRISTHAPRTGSDTMFGATMPSPRDFNPRSPHGERQVQIPIITNRTRFQPTLPARGATPRLVPRPEQLCISTHAPRTGSDAPPMTSVSPPSVFQPTLPARGATRRADSYIICTINFNPRSPHGERLQSRASRRERLAFQPTLPARGATSFQIETGLVPEISTHAPRTGSDPEKTGK